MKGYEVRVTVTFSVTFEVEAESDDEADASAKKLTDHLTATDGWIFMVPESAHSMYTTHDVDGIEADLDDVVEVWEKSDEDEDDRDWHFGTVDGNLCEAPGVGPSTTNKEDVTCSNCIVILEDGGA